MCDIPHIQTKATAITKHTKVWNWTENYNIVVALPDLDSTMSLDFNIVSRSHLVMHLFVYMAEDNLWLRMNTVSYLRS